MIILFELCLVFGLISVASSPSPYYAALGLVSAAGAGCLVLMSRGTSFLCLVLFLVYLGGMMVVFAYSSSLVVDQHPEAWGGEGVIGRLVVYIAMLMGWWLAGSILFGEVLVEASFEVEETVFVGSWFGVALLFSSGGLMLLVVGWALLLTLFVVLEVVSGHYSGVLRAL